MSSDYDEFVDELPVLGDEEWGALLNTVPPPLATAAGADFPLAGPGADTLDASGAPAEPPPTAEEERAEHSDSTDYGDDDDFDPSFLQAVDELERGLTQPAGAARGAHGDNGASASAHGASDQASRKRKACEGPGDLGEKAQKRTRVDQSGRFVSSGSPAKPEVNEVLGKFEDELSCPICCDLIVAAHVTNPCGHSFCGECGHQWLKVNKKTICPNCRTAVHRRAPMIPNIALDHAISVYVSSLASNGNAEWASGGVKFAEFVGRQERWKKIKSEQASPKKQRAAAPATPVRRPTIIDLLEVWGDYDDEDGDPSYEDDGLEMIAQFPRRRDRRAR